MDNKKEDIIFFNKMSLLREKNDVELQEIADITKINIKYLESIEKGDFDSIPNIYVRLFIRSYADFLKLDSKEILSDYDNYTNTKPKSFFGKKQKTTIEKPKEKEENKTRLNLSLRNTIQEKNDNRNLEKSITLENKKSINPTKEIKQKKSKTTIRNFDIKQNYFYSPESLLKIIGSFTLIIIVYLLISYLSKQQVSNVQNQNNPVINTELEIIIPETGNIKLNNDNFKSENFVSSTSERLKKINSPYVFQILTKKKTKLNISHDNGNGERIEDFNLIAPKDSLLKVVGENNIYFELWNSHHVDITINNNSIDDYLKGTNGLVRGEFNPTTKNLYLKFYKY